MAPRTPPSQQPLLWLVPSSYMHPMMSMMHKRAPSTMRMPLPKEFRKGQPEEIPLGMPAFRVLWTSIRRLRAALSRVVERCRVVMEVWENAWGQLSATGGAEGQERTPTGQEWNYSLHLEVSDEEEFFEEEEVSDEEEFFEEEEVSDEEEFFEEVEVSDEEEFFEEEEVSDEEEFFEGEVKIKMVECSELDLSDWLEWESEDEELPSNRAKSPAHGWSSPADPGLDSEGEQEEEYSQSDWSEDEDDDCEDSEEDSGLWESFLCSRDPLNPFRFSTPNGKEGRVSETDGAREREEEGEQTPRVQEKVGKKVCFSEEVVVRPLVVWRFASRAARDGDCWLRMARDRDRFRRRVQLASDIISPVLQANHRASVWKRCQLT